jgi:hypothetical protein
MKIPSFFCHQYPTFFQLLSLLFLAVVCSQYGGLVGIHTPCNELAHGTYLTEQGKTALVCLLGGGIIALLNPNLFATIAPYAQIAGCP